MMLHVRRKRRKAVCGGSAMLKETQKMLKGVMARNPRMHVLMSRYLGRVFSIMANVRQDISYQEVNRTPSKGMAGVLSLSWRKLLTATRQGCCLQPADDAAACCFLWLSQQRITLLATNTVFGRVYIHPILFASMLDPRYLQGVFSRHLNFQKQLVTSRPVQSAASLTPKHLCSPSAISTLVVSPVPST